jgi:pimeloyl-ACP methyl ester carboxylesterase
MTQQPVSLYYEERGQGKPIILIHGFPLDHSIWNEVVQQLADKARVITPDLRGYGASPKPEGDYSMRTMADDILALMDRLNLEKAIVAGHSMGGYITLAFAKAYPQRLSGVGLVATQAAADLPERRQARLILVDEIKRKGPQAVIHATLKKYSRNPEVLKYTQELMQKAAPHVLMACLRGMADREDMMDFLKEISVPTVVIAGEQDDLIPIERAFEVVERLQRGWVVSIPNAGHMPMMEAPQRVASAFIELLQQT